MSEGYIGKELDEEIQRVFQAGKRENDPAARLSADRFKAQVASGRLSSDAALGILRDDAKVSLLIEETRQDLAGIESAPRATPTPASAPPSLIDKDLASAILTGQTQMRAELAELRAVTEELRAATQNTVAATADLKAASEDIRTEVKKAVRALTLGAAFRTAVYLTPFTLVSSVAGNEVTPGVNAMFHWAYSQAVGREAATAVVSAPPRTLTVIIDHQEYRVVLPPPDGARRPRPNVPRDKPRVTRAKVPG